MHKQKSGNARKSKKAAAGKKAAAPRTEPLDTDLALLAWKESVSRFGAPNQNFDGKMVTKFFPGLKDAKRYVHEQLKKEFPEISVSEFEADWRDARTDEGDGRVFELAGFRIYMREIES
ncbi:MAG TPA: hypothetical protein VGM77_11205 [Gemmatimonadales bacterium]|jgi:hypothetical protein